MAAGGGRAVLAANCAVAPGEAAAWPGVEGEAIALPAGPLGPAATVAFSRA